MINFLSSLSLLNAAAIIGFFSLIVPIVIHLINRSKGELVYIGNVDLVKQANKIRVSEMKLTQWILLIIRLLMFLLITLLVSELVQDIEGETVDETHIYLTLDWLGSASKVDIESLQKKYPKSTLYSLASGFPKVSAENLYNQDQLPINAYAAIAEINQRQPQATKIIIYSRNRLNQFPQIRSELNKKIEWVIEPIQNTKLIAPPLSVEIYSNSSRALDREVIRTAFQVLNKNNSSLFETKFFTIENGSSTFDASKSSVHPDWILWLSEQPVAEEIMGLVQQGSFLLSDKKEVTSITKRKTVTLANISNLDVAFIDSDESLSTMESNHHSDTIWRDNLGDARLAVEAVGKGKIYQFNSRFNPDWTNLVVQESFPNLLAQLLLQNHLPFERSIVSTSEITGITTQEVKPQVFNSLHKWLVLLISLLWLFERWYAERRKGSNG